MRSPPHPSSVIAAEGRLAVVVPVAAVAVAAVAIAGDVDRALDRRGGGRGLTRGRVNRADRDGRGGLERRVRSVAAEDAEAGLLDLLVVEVDEDFPVPLGQ